MFSIKQGDTKTAMKAQLQSNGSPINLVNVERVTLRAKGSKHAFSMPAPIIDANQGRVLVVFEGADVQHAGRFYGEFVVTHADGRKEIFPNNEFIIIDIITATEG